MKVLFAIGNPQTSKAVIEQYKSLYGDDLEYKDVFYFKALLEEVKRDKSYERIVISEELEQAPSTSLEDADKFVFNNIDKITDEIEASKSKIIFICSDRRTRSDGLLSKLYGNGIYSILLGDDRSVSNLCSVIKTPKTKKEAKEYLRIDYNTSLTVDSTESDETVEEDQLISIRKYYDKLGDDTSKYIYNFDRIAEQYTPKQLKVIAAVLPPKVQEVLKSSDKYGYLFIGLEPEVSVINRPQPQKSTLLDRLRKGLNNREEENRKREEKRLIAEQQRLEEERIEKEKQEEMKRLKEGKRAEEEKRKQEEAMRLKEERAKAEAEAAERRRKEEQEREERRRAEEAKRKAEEEKAKAEAEAKRKAEEEKLKADEERRKAEQEAQMKALETARIKAEEEKAKQSAQTVEVIGIENNIEAEKAKQQEAAKKEEELRLQKEKEEKLKAELEAQRAKEIEAARIKAEEEARLKAQQEAARVKAELEAKRKAEEERIKAELEAKKKAEEEKIKAELEAKKKETESLAMAATQNAEEYTNFVRTVYEVPKDYKKVVALVGANKSGNTFILNAIANNISEKKVPTAILDMTKDKGVYYIYNQDDYKLRKIALECMKKLSEGVDSFIPASKFLHVYTSIPGTVEENRRNYKHKTLLDTVKKSNNLVLVDCDFTTPLEYFEQASEIYVVQDLDILKLQEMTMFLRELKSKNIDMSKIRVVINRYVKTTLTPKKLIEGLSYYNDPEMSFVDELLSGKVTYTIIPYNLDNYAKYIEGLYKNNISYKSYTQDFKDAVEQLCAQIYPVGGSNQVQRRRGLFNI